MLSRFCPLRVLRWFKCVHEKNNVKANVQQKEIKKLVAVSYKFLQELPSKLEIHCKKGMCIFFNSAWYSFCWTLSFLKNRGRG